MNKHNSHKQVKSARQKRLGEQIFREIRSQISFSTNDSLLKNTSIEKVEVNRDLSLATLYVRFLADYINLKPIKNSEKENQENQEKQEKKKSQEIREKIQYLNQNSGFFRSNLAHKLSIFKVPKIRFFYDDSLEEKQRIDALFEKINSK